MKRKSWIVTSDDIRPAGPQDRCLYCKSRKGREHEAGCVTRKKTIVCEVKINLVRVLPEDWDEDMINFHMNESSWCFDNIAEEISDAVERTPDGTCLLCHVSEGGFVRDATEGDEERFQLFVEKL